MIIKLTLFNKKNIVVPIGFNEYIKGFIYSNIQDDWLHDVGFSNGKRNFKLFVFSLILQKGRYNKEKIVRFGVENRFVIVKGWSGNFVLTAEKEFFRVCFECMVLKQKFARVWIY